MPAIQITVNGQTRTAQLADNPTVRDLLDQLPLTLRFRDFSQVEKIAKLPRRLTTNGAPDGSDPDPGDVGYYAPSGDLVLYYGDVGFYSGIIHLGRFTDGDLAVVVGQPDGFTVAIKQA